MTAYNQQIGGPRVLTDEQLRFFKAVSAPETGGITITGLSGVTAVNFSLVTHTNPGSSEELAFATGATACHRLNLDVASCALTFSGAVNLTPAEIVLTIAQDATGGRLVTWPAAVKWAGGVAPILSTTPSALDRLHFATEDGGTTIYGAVIGFGYA